MAEFEVVGDDERDERIYRMRVAGGAVRTIARQSGLTVADVNRIIERKMVKVDNQYRVNAVALDLERLDELLLTFMQRARNGDTDAGGLCVRIMRRRAEMLGVDAPLKIDPVQLIDVARPQTSTEYYRGVLDRLMGVGERERELEDREDAGEVLSVEEAAELDALRVERAAREEEASAARKARLEAKRTALAAAVGEPGRQA